MREHPKRSDLSISKTYSDPHGYNEHRGLMWLPRVVGAHGQRNQLDKDVARFVDPYDDVDSIEDGDPSL
ncbi:hypothetical protein OHB12_02835 [Nocardia sp. NBC_01730]|uniref:hypothetical protein n=1 Tax=Nocardia sp. NBC_01730 TaxID=2975998 RepID=UPI002E1420A7|nr:hypothetical protein OHB12_02835 [Nocardia sp. NBC_01730]